MNTSTHVLRDALVRPLAEVDRRMKIRNRLLSSESQT